MDRRSFLKVSLHATGTAAVAGLPAGAALAGERAQPVELRPDARVLAVSVASTADVPGAGASVARMAQRLAAVTDGRLGLRSVERGAGPLTTVSSGSAEAAFGPLVDDATLSPVLALLAGLPGSGAPSAEMFAAWYEAAGGQTLLDDAAAALGVRAIAAGDAGGNAFLYARSAGPMRLVGRRIAAAGIAADVLRQLGAEPVALSAEALAPALADGQVDAVEAPALTALALGLPGVARGYARTALHAGGQVSVLAIGQATWDTLSGPERSALELVAGEEWRVSRAEQMAHGAVLAAVLAAAGTAEAAVLSGDLAEFDAGVARWVADAARHDGAAERVLASLAAVAPKAAIA
jgi:TRAP-type mannitol/chloroaromatic compound transport system substrate-binding protein